MSGLESVGLGWISEDANNTEDAPDNGGGGKCVAEVGSGLSATLKQRWEVGRIGILSPFPAFLRGAN